MLNRKVVVTEEYLRDIGDALREKDNRLPIYKPAEMGDAIRALNVGNLNLVFGDTEPENTQALWMNSSTPSDIQIASELPPEERVYTVIDTGYRTPDEKLYTALRVGNEIYLANRQSISKFHPETGEFIVVKTFDTPIYSCNGVISVGTKIYYFGSDTVQHHSDEIFAFDTETKLLTKLSTLLPRKLDTAATVAINDKIYILSGSYREGTGVTSHRYSECIYVFDTVNESITVLDATYPLGGTEYAHAVAYGENIFFGGGLLGYDLNTGLYSKSTNIYVLNTVTQQIRLIDSKFPEDVNTVWGAVIQIQPVVMGNKILYIGRRGVYSNTIFILDPETEELTQVETEYPADVFGMQAIAFGNLIYLFGGSTDEPNWKDYNYVFELNITKFNPLTAGVLFIRTGTENPVVIYNNQDSGLSIQVCVDSVYIGNQDSIAEKIEAYRNQDGTWTNIEGS